MKILVVVDMQNDFIDGVLGTPEAKKIVPNVVDKIKNCSGDTVVLFTKDTHYEDYLETQEGKNLPVKHCIMGTHGWSINDDVSNAAKNFNGALYSSMDVVNGRIIKETFGSTLLPFVIADIEEDNKIDSIELIGLDSDICVLTNALVLKTYFPEIPIFVDASCCAGVTHESHNNAMAAMKMCQINVMNWEN